MADGPQQVSIARCPEHGLHGQREACFECGGPVEQVPVLIMPEGQDLQDILAAFDAAQEHSG